MSAKTAYRSVEVAFKALLKKCPDLNEYDQLVRDLDEALSVLWGEISSPNPHKSGWTYEARKEQREKECIPAWVPLGDDDPDFRRLFVEDDARPPDAESGRQAWERIFGEVMDPTTQRAEYDGGDCVAHLMPGNRVFEVSFDGTSIYQYVPPRKFD